LKKKSVVKATPQKFFIDYSGPANDKIFDAAAYEKFLVDHIKVEGKTGQLGEDVKLSREGKSIFLSLHLSCPHVLISLVNCTKLGAGKLSVTSSVPFSKRYLKYLTKKFLKKNQMREWLRVVATSKDTYTLKVNLLILPAPIRLHRN